MAVFVYFLQKTCKTCYTVDFLEASIVVCTYKMCVDHHYIEVHEKEF